MRICEVALILALPCLETGPWAQTHYPRSTFDLDAFQADLDSLGAAYGAPTLGTLTRPVPPRPPQGVLVPATAAGSAQLAETAALGGRDITLTVDCAGPVSLGRAADVIIRLNGRRIHSLDFNQYGRADASGTRILIVGPGRIGTVSTGQTHAGYPPATDVLFDGVWIGPDFLTAPESAPAVNCKVLRVGFVNCIIRGHSGSGSIGCGYLGTGDDLVFFNTNIGAGLRTTGFNDDWGYRSGDGSNRHVLADCMIRSRVKPCVRQGGDGVRGRVLWSTPRARGTARMLTLYNRHHGSMDASVGAGNMIVTDRIVSRHVRWIAGDDSGERSPLFGPHTDSGFRDAFYLWSDIRLTTVPGLLEALGAAGRGSRERYAEPGETWDLDGGINAETVVATLPEPAWPEVISPSVGRIGSDPYADPAPVGVRPPGGKVPPVAASDAGATRTLLGRKAAGARVRPVPVYRKGLRPAASTGEAMP